MTKTFFIVAVALLMASARAAAPAAPAPAADQEPENGEIRRGVPMSGTPQERSRQFYERIIAKVEPSMKGKIDKLPIYLDLFKREFVEDVRTFAIELVPAVDDKGVQIIRGHVEFEEHKTALVDFLQHLGLSDVRDRTELLPSEKLIERRFGLVTVPRTFVYDKPSGRVEKVTECTHGEVLFILREADNSQLLVHAGDGYVGYVVASHVRRITEPMLLEMEAVVPITHEREIEQMIEAAKAHLGTPYVWGGVTKDGLDCSGLVRQSFKAAGVNLPRDADQQSLTGRLVATRWHRRGLRRGDTLYFLGRRGTIHHTAIYLGENQFIEATDPVVKISSFDPEDPAYAKRRDDSFCFAKRVFE